MRRRTALVLAACLLSAACTGQDEPAPTSARGTDRPQTPAAAPPPSPSAVPAPASAPPFDADTAPDSEQAEGGQLTVVAVRVARQDGYDRIVFELAGREPGKPGWRVEYEDDPRQDGSGNPVEVRGDATLVVRIDGAGYPYDTGQEEARETSTRDALVVQEVRLGSVFEGVHTSFVGVTGERPFRVTRLADPARVVVDVRHDEVGA